MPELRSVYFAPDGLWFPDRESCLEYEKIQEIRQYIMNETMPTNIAEKLIKRYTMEERWDWKAQEESDGS